MSQKGDDIPEAARSAAAAVTKAVMVVVRVRSVTAFREADG